MIINVKKAYFYEGDCRTIKKFAIFPRRCENDHYHWLEYVEIFQKWVYSEGWCSMNKDEGNLFPCICNQKEKHLKNLEINGTYVFKPNETNPFSRKDDSYVKIVDISGEYVQYIFVDENGKNDCASPTKWDSNIRSFKMCYKKKEAK